MTEAQVHGALVRAVIAVAAVTFLFLHRVTAPCGRHYAGAGWGSHMPGRLGWIVLEAPAVAVFAAVCLDGKTRGRSYRWRLSPCGRSTISTGPSSIRCANRGNGCVRKRGGP